MPSRREFLSASAAMGALAATHSLAATATPSKSPKPCLADCDITELNDRIARRDFRGMTKDMLPTPCIVVDLDMFNANVKHMADTAKTNGINVRPHVKVHKSVDVAKASGTPPEPSASPAPPSPRPSSSPRRHPRACSGPSSPSASTTSSEPSPSRKKTPPSCS